MSAETTITEVPASNEQITIAPEHKSAEVPVVVPSTTTETPTTELPVVAADLMDEFDAIKDGIKPKPSTEVKPKVEDKKVEVPATTDVKKVEAVVPVVDRKTGRDYAGLTDDVVPLFKAMSNDAFNKFKPLYLAHQEQTKKVTELETKLSDSQKGKTSIPESYYEHPLAFALTPEYETAANQVNETNTIFQHWSEQLKAVQNGAATFKTLARDASGKIIYGPDATVNKDSAVSLLAHFNRTQQAAANAAGQLSALQQNHSAKHQQSLASVSELENKMFAVFNDEKHPAQAKIKATLDELPASVRSSPLARMTAKALVTIQSLMNVITKERAEYAAGTKVATKIAETTKEVGPSTTGAATGAQASAITMDDFEKAKE